MVCVSFHSRPLSPTHTTALETPGPPTPVRLNPLLSHPLHRCLRSEVGDLGRPADGFVSGPVGLEESVTQMGKGFLSHFPISLCPCEHYYCHPMYNSNSQPRPQTGGWRWSSSGRPQSWSLRTGPGSRPPCCGFRYSARTAQTEGPSLPAADTTEWYSH